MAVDNKQEKYSALSVIAVFLIGNLIIRFPKGEGQQHSFIGFIICFLSAVTLVFFLNKVQFSKKEFGIELFDKAINNAVLKNVVKVLFFVLILLCFTTTTKDYCVMLGEIRLQRIPRLILCLVYLGTILILSRCKLRVISYFAFTNLIIVSLGVILMFLFSINLFDLDYLKEGFTFNGKNVINQGLTFFIHSFGQVYLCVFLFAKHKNQNSGQGVLAGVLVGGGLLLICFLNVILSIGATVINELQYPYASVTAMLVSNNAYNRMDAVTYYVYFICNLIKSTVLLKLTGELTKSNILKISMCILALVCSLIFSLSDYLNALLLTKTFNFILLSLEILVPTVVAVCLNTKKIKQKTD